MKKSAHLVIALVAIVSLTLLVSFVSCDKAERVAPTQTAVAESHEPFYPDSFRTRAIPEDLHSRATWAQKVDWIRRQSNSDLFKYGLSRSPYGNVLTDQANMRLTDEQRLTVLAFMAHNASVRGVDLPPMRDLMMLAPVDSIDEVITPGSPENLTVAVTQRVGIHRLVFVPGQEGLGPDYGFEYRNERALDKDPVYGTDYYYLHRTNGSSTGSLLSWTTSGTSLVRTTGVAIPSYQAPTAIAFFSAFKYVADADRGNNRINYPYEYTYNNARCPSAFSQNQSCTFKAVMHRSHGTVFRPGCYSDNETGCGLNATQQMYVAACGASDDIDFNVFPTMFVCDGQAAATRGCPNAHLYYDNAGTPTYTGYNDERWRVDGSVSDYTVYSTTNSSTISSADYGLITGKTLYVTCAPYFRAWAHSEAGSSINIPIWFQMFDGWLSDTNWSASSNIPEVWRGAANILRNSGDAWRAGLGSSGCSVPDGIWGPIADANSCSAGSGNCAYPWKQLMSWVNNPWVQAGYLYGKFKTFQYCTACPNGPCQEIDNENYYTHADWEFGHVDLTNNSYTDYLKVTYEEKQGS